MKNLLDKQYENLRVAYNNTIYRCLDPSVELCIGEWNRDVDKLLEESGYNELCILTAYNPQSIVQHPDENQKAQKQMNLELKLAGFDVFQGENIDPGGDFPVEKTSWVIGLGMKDTIRLARNYNQNAFVYCCAGEKPELIWTIT